MASALDWVLCSIVKLECTKVSGKETCEMAEAWRDTRTETDMKENL